MMGNPIAVRTVFSLLTLAAVALGRDAAAGETPGSYVDWNFDGVTGLTDVAYTITVTKDPNHAAQIFWSNQVGFSNGRGAYAGMQTNGGAERMFLFSVWNATEYVAGAGSYCQMFGGEGVGVSCRRMDDWSQGDTYEFHYVAEGNGWWGMTVTNLNKHTAFKLGSIKVGANLMNPASVSWAEYFRWNDPRSSCESEPFSRARFDAPIANHGTRVARIVGTSVGLTCTAYSRVENAGTYAVHTNAIGNSAMAPIVNGAGGCLSVADTGGLVIDPCDGRDNQIWVYALDNTLRSKSFACATADGDAAIAGLCNSARGKWRQVGNSLVETSSGKCLTSSAGGATVSPCDGTTAQQWRVDSRGSGGARTGGPLPAEQRPPTVGATTTPCVPGSRCNALSNAPQRPATATRRDAPRQGRVK